MIRVKYDKRTYYDQDANYYREYITDIGNVARSGVMTTPGYADAKRVHYDFTSGNDSTGTGTAANPYKTYAKAVTECAADEVIVCLDAQPQTASDRIGADLEKSLVLYNSSGLTNDFQTNFKELGQDALTGTGNIIKKVGEYYFKINSNNLSVSTSVWSSFTTCVTPASGTMLMPAYNGSIYLAIDTAGRIYRSSDGTNWSEVNDTSTVNMRSIVSNGTRFVLGGFDGIFYTDNGDEYDSVELENGYDVAYGITAVNEAVIIRHEINSPWRYSVSLDGRRFINLPGFINFRDYADCYYFRGTYYIIGQIGRTAGGQWRLYMTKDFQNFSKPIDDDVYPLNASPVRIAEINNKLVYVAANCLFYSDDGQTFTKVEFASNATTAFFGDNFLAVTRNTSSAADEANATRYFTNLETFESEVNSFDFGTAYEMRSIVYASGMFYAYVFERGTENAKLYHAETLGDWKEYTTITGGKGNMTLLSDDVLLLRDRQVDTDGHSWWGVLSTDQDLVYPTFYASTATLLQNIVFIQQRGEVQSNTLKVIGCEIYSEDGEITLNNDFYAYQSISGDDVSINCNRCNLHDVVTRGNVVIESSSVDYISLKNVTIDGNLRFIVNSTSDAEKITIENLLVTGNISSNLNGAQFLSGAYGGTVSNIVLDRSKVMAIRGTFKNQYKQLAYKKTVNDLTESILVNRLPGSEYATQDGTIYKRDVGAWCVDHSYRTFTFLKAHSFPLPRITKPAEGVTVDAAQNTTMSGQPRVINNPDGQTESLVLDFAPTEAVDRAVVAEMDSLDDTTCGVIMDDENPQASTINVFTNQTAPLIAITISAAAVSVGSTVRIGQEIFTIRAVTPETGDATQIILDRICNTSLTNGQSLTVTSYDSNNWEYLPENKEYRRSFTKSRNYMSGLKLRFTRKKAT